MTLVFDVYGFVITRGSEVPSTRLSVCCFVNQQSVTVETFLYTHGIILDYAFHTCTFLMYKFIHITKWSIHYVILSQCCSYKFFCYT